MRLPFPVDFFTKVLVVRDQNPILGLRLIKNVIVIHSTRFIENGKGLVGLLAKPTGNGRTGAFIHEESHLRRLCNQGHEGSTGQRL